MKQNCCVLTPAYQPPEKFLEYAAVLRAAGENFARIAAATVGARLVSMLVNYTLENLLSQYDCLVVVEPDRTEQRMLQKHFGVDGSAGFYRIEKPGTLLRLKAE